MAGILAVVVLAAGGTVYSVPGVSKPLKTLLSGTRTDIVTTVARSAPLPITVVEKGSLESSVNQDAYCDVEGQTTIIEIKPEGTPVKKGDIVCVLDSAALRDQLTNQQIATKSAAAAYENAKLTREVAEIAVKEYEEGIFLQDLQTVDGEIKLAEADVARAEDRLDWARRMFEKGYVSLASKNSEELSLRKARFTLEQAETKKRVLIDYTKGKTIKELKSEVEKAHSDELAKQQTWDLENNKEKKLERQIAKCEIRAPSDGLVVYANDPNRSFMSNAPQIEEGATVRERQKIFSLPDMSKMQVNTKVHESQIDKITRRLKARIRVDAFADQVLDGEVVDVAALPDSTNFFSSDIKVYTTKVRIEKPIAGLRPGMTAEVEILVDRKENVVSVPVMAVLQFAGKDHVTKKIDDRFVQTEVELGVANERYVEVTKGLKEGDIVVMDPAALMTDEEKRVAFGSAGKPSKKAWGAAAPETAETKAAAPGAAPAVALKGAGGPGADAGAPGAKAAANKGAGGAARKKGFQRPAFFAKIGKLSQDEQQSLRNPSTTEEERTALYKKAGMTDEEIQQAIEFGARMRAGGGGFGRGGGGGGFGGGGGGFGGGGGGRRGGGGPPGGDGGGSDQ